MFNKVLTLSILFIGLLIVLRIIYSGNLRYVSMCWNIFLAWIPYVLSGYCREVKDKAAWKQLFLFISWLLFLPNALYMVTDLIHLGSGTNVPLWYDAVLLFASAFIGVMMAFISIQKVKVYLEKKFSTEKMKFFIPAILFLASFGVYLGRFERWNSWDVIHNPLGLTASILDCFTSPVDNYKVWLITFILTGIYSMLYLFITLLPQIFSEEKFNERR